MPMNIDVLKLIALLLLFKGNNQSPSLSLPAMAYELHKISRFINRLDSFGQIALNPPSPASLSSPPEYKENSFPDLNTIMENIGPIMAALGSKYNDDENRNAIF